MKTLAYLGAVLLAGCAVTVDERTVFQPQPPEDSWGDAYDTGIAGERYFADPASYPFADHGLTARVEHEVADSIQTSLVTLAGEDAAPGPRPLVVNCFGNASDRWRTGLKYGRKLVPYGDVLLYDYPGYNGAPGEPTGAALEAQADALVAHVREAQAGRQRIYWGHSLGGFVCAELAARDPDSTALILETTAPDVASVVDAWLPWYAKSFVRPRVADSLTAYDTPRTAAATGLPVLVIGAARDDVLPVGLHRALHERLAAAGADVTYLEFEDASHFDLGDQPGFDAGVAAFLKAALP